MTSAARLRLRPDGAGQDEEWTAPLPSSHADLQKLLEEAAERVPHASRIFDEGGSEAAWLDLEAGKIYYISATDDVFPPPGSKRFRVDAGGATGGTSGNTGGGADAERGHSCIYGEEAAAASKARVVRSKELGRRRAHNI